MPPARRLIITDITEAVCGVCLDARTSLVCVDEIHNLNLATRNGADASDTLKHFSASRPPSSTPGSASSGPGCYPAPAASRSQAGSGWSGPGRSPAMPSGAA